MKGVKLGVGQCGVLMLDGTLVFVEKVEPAYMAVVALPDQPPERANDRVFTPGRVGVKKISAFALADRIVPFEELSERNRRFLEIDEPSDKRAYVTLRETKPEGANYVDRTPEEAAAHELKMNPPVKVRTPKPPKEKKDKGGPRYLQRCTQCGEQPGHICHGSPDGDSGKHEFVAPAAPVLACAACDKLQDDPCHAEGTDTFTHRFMPPGKPARAPRPPKPEGEATAKPAREAKAPREARVKPSKPTGRYRWTNDEAKHQILKACNGKYNDGNSGACLVDAIKATGDAGLAPTEFLAQANPKGPGTLERVQLAYEQLAGAGLIELAPEAPDASA